MNPHRTTQSINELHCPLSEVFLPVAKKEFNYTICALKKRKTYISIFSLSEAPSLFHFAAAFSASSILLLGRSLNHFRIATVRFPKAFLSFLSRDLSSTSVTSSEKSRWAARKASHGFQYSPASVGLAEASRSSEVKYSSPASSCASLASSSLRSSSSR